jgi:geranylgeranyl pyrophosphate synthase
MQVRSRVALLDKIMHYIVHRKGKQMRPIFVVAVRPDVLGKLLRKLIQLLLVVNCFIRLPWCMMM